MYSLSCLCGFVATYMLACCPSMKSQHEVRPPCLLQKASDKHTNTLHTHNDPLQMCAVILSRFATFVRNVLLERHSQHFPLGVNDQEPSSAPPGPGPPCVFCFPAGRAAARPAGLVCGLPVVWLVGCVVVVVRMSYFCFSGRPRPAC